jgi:hypothetical protein
MSMKKEKACEAGGAVGLFYLTYFDWPTKRFPGAKKETKKGNARELPLACKAIKRGQWKSFRAHGYEEYGESRGPRVKYFRRTQKNGELDGSAGRF